MRRVLAAAVILATIGLLAMPATADLPPGPPPVDTVPPPGVGGTQYPIGVGITTNGTATASGFNTTQTLKPLNGLMGYCEISPSPSTLNRTPDSFGNVNGNGVTLFYSVPYGVWLVKLSTRVDCRIAPGVSLIAGTSRWARYWRHDSQVVGWFPVNLDNWAQVRHRRMANRLVRDRHAMGAARPVHHLSSHGGLV